MAILPKLNTMEFDKEIPFEVSAPFEPMGDQPRAIRDLAAGIENGQEAQVLQVLRAALPTGTAVVSVGGVTDADDVQARLDAGADLAQGYTAFLYEGPFWAGRITAGLARSLRG